MSDNAPTRDVVGLLQVAEALDAMAAPASAAVVRWAAESLTPLMPDDVAERVAMVLWQASVEAEEGWVTEPDFDWSEAWGGYLLIDSERDEWVARARALLPALAVALRHP